MKTIFTFLFAGILFSLHAQVLNTIVYDKSNSGLPDDFVRDLEITSSDVLWMNVSGEGTVSFDGTTWMQYTMGTVNFPGMYINDLTMDNNNNVYVVGGSMVSKWNGTSWIDITPPNFFSGGALAKDPSGTSIWLGDYNGLQKYNGSTWTPTIASTGSSFSPTGMMVAPNNDIWTVSIGDAYVTKYDQGASAWTIYDTNNVALFDKQWWYDDVNITHDNKIIVGGAAVKSLYFNGTTWGDLDAHSGLSMSVVQDITIRNNVSWIGMCNGFGLASYNGSTWKKYTTVPSYIPITGLRFDSQGYLWMSSLNGLFKINSTSLDLNDPNALNDVALLYPSPADGLMTLKFLSSNWQNAQVMVLDISGKQVFSLEIQSSENQLDLTHLPSGVYTLNMRTDNGSYFQKIVLY